MRVQSANDSASGSEKPEKPEKTEKTERKSKASHKKAKATETDEAGKPESVKAQPKTDSPKDTAKPAPTPPADTHVTLSPQAKEKSESDRELTQAETLMQHVSSGKLSGEEKDLAMGRIGEILKKYGKA